MNIFFYSNITMPAGRKKKERLICFDPSDLVCGCMGPVKLPKSELRKLEKVQLGADELQALIYKDLDNLTMKNACEKMGISKTVFANLYSSGRRKQTDCLVNGKILTVQCEE